MPKDFIDYDQQLELLRNKALTINDDEQAKRKLSQIGYFSLIGSYKHPFKDKTTKKYRNNVTFDDIVMLYTLDMDLRNLFLKHLLIIERSVKSQMAYVFCDKHGASQTCLSRSPKLLKCSSKKSDDSESDQSAAAACRRADVLPIHQPSPDGSP